MDGKRLGEKRVRSGCGWLRLRVEMVAME